MKEYIGTKIISAKPMTRAEYNALRGWEVPADENPHDEGYLVEYSDGGKPNHPGFKGYISWSPKDIFERAYHQRADKPHDHQVRVIGEKAELDARVHALMAFIETSPVYESLPDIERALMRDQLLHMSRYSAILQDRITLFASPL